MAEDLHYLESQQIQVVAAIMEQVDLDVWGLMIDAEDQNEIWVRFDTEVQTPILMPQDMVDRLEQIDVEGASKIIWELGDHNIDEAEGTFHITVEAIVITGEREKVSTDG